MGKTLGSASFPPKPPPAPNHLVTMLVVCSCMVCSLCFDRTADSWPGMQVEHSSACCEGYFGIELIDPHTHHHSVFCGAWYVKGWGALVLVDKGVESSAIGPHRQTYALVAWTKGGGGTTYAH